MSQEPHNEADNAQPKSFVRFWLGLESSEFKAVTWSFLYYFCLLSAYYVLRPMREAMAILGGTQNIPWLFTGTFVAMLIVSPIFGWVASRFSRKQFIPWVYYFFVLNILFFFAAFTYYHNTGQSSVWIGRSFFIWISVFNLFVVSVFWSFMADIYSKEQGRRLFGMIAGGGSAGAILGPMLTSILVVPLGHRNLLPISAALLLLSVYFVIRLRRWADGHDAEHRAYRQESAVPFGGSSFKGINEVFTSSYLRVASIMTVMASVLGTAVYMYQAELVSQSIEGIDFQTRIFSILDFTSNILSLIGQLFLARHVVRKFGVGAALAILPVVSVIGFSLLAANPALLFVVVFNALRRGVTFGFTKPASEMLFTVLPAESKYKAKNFMDTVVYRAGDVTGAWLIKHLSVLGLSTVALLLVPVAALWVILAIWLGRAYKKKYHERTLKESA